MNVPSTLKFRIVRLAEMSKTGLSKRKFALVSIATVLAILVAVIVGVEIYYSNRALPGSTVAGRDVSGMTRDQVSEELATELDASVISLNGAIDPVEADLSAVGVSVDVPATVDEVFAPNRGLVTRMTSLFSSRDVTPVVEVNDEELTSFLDGLQGEGISPVKNGSVVFDEDQQLFVAEPAEAGSRIDVESTSSQITDAVKAMTFTPIQVSVVEVAPSVDPESAQATVARANQWLQTEFSIVDRDDVVHAADMAAKVSWIKFEDVEGALQVTTDSQAIQSWVEEHSAESNVAPDAKIENVNSAGTVVSVAHEGNDGYVAANAQALAEALAASLLQDQPFQGEVEYKVEERPTEQRLIADGAENLAYPAAPGEKWIDINLSNHSVTAYEGATVVLSSPMVAGAPLTPTITGEYNVWAKVPIQTMRGKNADGTDYETPNVPWILYFHGGYATHGAPWRANFGYDAGAAGSHGCVNMPVDQAKSLYDWADVGTKVVSHF